MNEQNHKRTIKRPIISILINILYFYDEYVTTVWDDTLPDTIGLNGNSEAGK